MVPMKVQATNSYSYTYLRKLRTGMRIEDPGSNTFSVTSKIGSLFGISIDVAITIPLPWSVELCTIELKYTKLPYRQPDKTIVNNNSDQRIYIKSVWTME